MVSVDKHQSPSLKYTAPSGVHIPPGEPDFEHPLCQTCLGDHAFQRGVLPAEKESCSWELQSACEVKEQRNHASILTKPDPRTFWTNDDSARLSAGFYREPGKIQKDKLDKIIKVLRKETEQLEEMRRPQKSVAGGSCTKAVNAGPISALWVLVLIRKKKVRRQRNFLTMTVKTEAARGTVTYSRMRGMVAILIAFMKQRRMGLNDFIQKIANNSYACKHPEVQSILKISQPQEPELMNANPSPPPSPSQQINLGPSSNPHAKPSDFHFLKVIGKGSFGKVLLARHKAEEAFYAVKVLQKKAILKKKEEKHIMSERNVLLKNVKHPFLVGLHFSFQTADKLYFVLDYINGGELFYHLQRERCFLEPRARFYAAEIASALGYLHSLNIVYRDLKPENILLDSQGHIVLTDFGLCKENIEHNGTTSTFCGTPEYLAPEVLHKQPYDRTVDWWCLGAVLYEMLYGLPPFYSRNTAEMYDNILNKPLQLKPNITNSARHLLEGLLQKDRTKRLGAKDDFMELKSHIFFSLINWDDLINKKIMPPFNPNVSGPSDLRHFDPEFTEEPVPNSIGRSPDSILITASVKEAAEAFLGFSYAPPMDPFL
ncbi:Serine/threonine-protein kinase Sgk1 [Fukomys damarensis]|uniref:non-specific serine/threonine protein kinase n=2 Tax=Fukomys damarensis TaxID=885580 RepID=A0A091DPP7_FUKDA|nr:Serine/threonine-protein kinase Sgk1 [Fukomys damarensis]